MLKTSNVEVIRVCFAGCG